MNFGAPLRAAPVGNFPSPSLRHCPTMYVYYGRYTGKLQESAVTRLIRSTINSQQSIDPLLYTDEVHFATLYGSK